MRVLLVDDESRYRVYLRARLASEGHEVAVAGTGREAIDRGVLFQPEVLVADWMLRNHVHGLHVSDALRSVDPRLSTILITGFASNGLRRAADEARVAGFLEKPFELDDLVTAVARARLDRRRVKAMAPFGVLATDRAGVIVRSSRRLRRMLRHTTAGPHATRIDQVLAPETLAELRRPDGEWVHAVAVSERRVRWWARARSSQGGETVVLLPERKNYLRHDPNVRMLLRLPGPGAAGWLPDGAILLLGPPGQDATAVEPFERLGWPCFLAETADLALRMLASNPTIQTLLVDAEASGLQLPEFVASLRGLRHDVRVVGTSSALRDEMEFAGAGVPRFLHRPWRVGDLIDILEG